MLPAVSFCVHVCLFLCDCSCHYAKWLSVSMLSVCVGRGIWLGVCGQAAVLLALGV